MDGLQPVADHDAIGGPQVSGSGAFAVISVGIELRGKKNTETPESSHFTGRNLANFPELIKSITYSHKHHPRYH